MTARRWWRLPLRRRAATSRYAGEVLLSRPPAVPWWLVVPVPVGNAFGAAYAVWAFMKTVGALTPQMRCGGPPPSVVAMAVASGIVEGAIGLAVAAGAPRLRRAAALAGTGLNVGLVGFACVASARGVETEGCGCFGGLDLPWFWHAAIAAALALAFLAILLDGERRFAPAPTRESD